MGIFATNGAVPPNEGEKGEVGNKIPNQKSIGNNQSAVSQIGQSA